MFAKIVNILIFAFILYYYLRKPAKAFLRERRKHLSDLIKVAHDTYNMAAAEEEKIRRRLSNAKEEIEQLTSELRKEAEFEKSKIIVDAKKYAEEMIKDAKIIAKNETANAISTVKVAVIDQVVVLAKRRLATEITADQYKNLADSAIKEIEPML